MPVLVCLIGLVAGTVTLTRGQYKFSLFFFALAVGGVLVGLYWRKMFQRQEQELRQEHKRG